ncbi:hypothetical protein [Aliikangiella coralliicola]|uniref:Sugar transporter n=1 Tax=Aliikangiella coralliicola TaxID=2592383 RepID=A0A545UGH7_9GAMM|nr:hypothetical protein [Aliikangiella coralliicola]TQV88503.1 hypothetical protein FLL46_08235 [Aliikangiella coralliicola]
MSEQQNIKLPTWFWVVSGLALVWNLLGVMAFVGQMMMTPEMMAELPQAEQELYAATPAWANIAFGFAVWGGALGAVALLMKKSWATPLFIISLTAVLVQMYYAFFISKSFEVFGPGRMIMPVMVIVIAIALVWLSNKAKSDGWIS